MTFYVVSKGRSYRVLVDDEHSDLVKKFTWWRKPNGYIYTQRGGRNNRQTIYLHRLVMGASRGEEVDHINREPADNRCSNLRFCTRSQQNMNKNGVRGVSRFREGWRARIKVNRKERHIGVFSTKKKAILARREVEKQLFKEYANV